MRVRPYVAGNAAPEAVIGRFAATVAHGGRWIGAGSAAPALSRSSKDNVGSVFVARTRPVGWCP